MPYIWQVLLVNGRYIFYVTGQCPVPLLIKFSRTTVYGYLLLHISGFNRLTSFMCWCLITRITGYMNLLFLKCWEFVWVQWYVWTDIPVLSPIYEDWVMNNQFLTQGDCSRKSIRNGNQTSALKQGLGHNKYSLLPLGYRTWQNHFIFFVCFRLVPSSKF